MKYSKVSSDFIINIESCYISKSETVELNITGWAFSKKSNKPLNIEILEMKTDNIKIMKYERQDVYKAYSSYKSALNSGFKITIYNIQNKEKIKIKFEDETRNKKNKHTINIKKLLNEKEIPANIYTPYDSNSKTKSPVELRKNINVKYVNKNEKGLNLIGFNRAEMGLGQGFRYLAEAIDIENINFGIKNFTGLPFPREKDLTWMHKEIDKPIYNSNLFFINPDMIQLAYNRLGKGFWSGRYNIGFWLWELPDFPDEWVDKFKYVDEVWAPSKFVVNSIKAKSPVPVIYIPHSFKLEKISKISREDLGLPINTFLFLTMYDIKSVKARKNPHGVIKTFKSTFKPNDKSVGLVVKINGARFASAEVEKLIKLARGYDNIYFIKETLDRADVNALLRMVDCFVSLHRAEGFGMVMAEAMYLGTPVIGTNWSGNTDFMNEDNSCLVKYKLVKVGKDYGPYKAYQIWAEPDKEHASYYMKKLIADKNYYNKLVCNGKETIRKNFSPEAVGKMIRNRLEELYLL